LGIAVGGSILAAVHCSLPIVMWYNASKLSGGG
jgi:hypothetical protein